MIGKEPIKSLWLECLKRLTNLRMYESIAWGNRNVVNRQRAANVRVSKNFRYENP